MTKTVDVPKGGKKETASFCSEVCRGRLGSCLECVVDHVAFEDWLRRKYQESGIFVNTRREVNYQNE